MAFALAILAYAEANLCVDMRRVFLAGFSTGGFLSYTLACQFPDKFAGIGVNAGSIGRGHIDACKSITGAVPVQGFHSLAAASAGTKLAHTNHPIEHRPAVVLPDVRSPPARGARACTV